MKLTNKEIDELFANDYFIEKMTKFIVDNLNIRQDYDLYKGEYDNMTFSFNEQPIEIKSKSYGY